MRIIICDDCKSDREEYLKVIEKLCKKNNISSDITLCQNASQLMFKIDEDGDFVDLIFLDINMPEINGIQAADEIRKTGFRGEIIFLTVSEQHMLQAFDVKAFHYIVKKRTSKSEFEKILLNAVDAIKLKEKEYITFNGVGENRNIPISEIKYFRSYKRIITVHFGNDTFEFYSQMGKLELTLMQYDFIRIHKSYILSKRHVEVFTSKEVKLIDGTVLPVGRKYHDNLKNGMVKILD